VEGHEYLTTKGDTSREVLWCLDTSLPFRVFYKESDEWNITRTDHASATRSWKILDVAGNVRILAERRDNRIRVEGSVKGRQVQKEIAIDGAPWFQATSWSLRRFVLSGESEIEFWTLRPDTLKAYKVIAKRQTEEVVQLDKGAVPAVRIELRLTGMLAPFWKSRYWFRSKDGFFLEVVPKPSIGFKVKAERGGQPQTYYSILRIGRHAPTPDLSPRGGFETTSTI
jgi:hypothetical protein